MNWERATEIITRSMQGSPAEDTVLRMVGTTVTSAQSVVAEWQASILERPYGLYVYGRGQDCAQSALDELIRRFDVRITIAALGASAGAIGIARYLLGPAPGKEALLWLIRKSRKSSPSCRS